MSDWYRTSRVNVLKQMQVSEKGLDTQTARTILAQVGENALQEQAHKKACSYGNVHRIGINFFHIFILPGPKILGN